MSVPNKPTTTRRNFIRTSSAFLTLPWLETYAAAGAAPPTPRRIVSICTAFGLYGPSFFPEQAGKDYTPSEYTAILGDDLRKHFTVFSGISHPEIGGDHASEVCFLTSARHPTANTFRNTVSLDYLAARHVGGATRFPLLSLRTHEGGSGLTYTGTGAAVPPLDSPSKVFARMFLAGNPKEVEAEIARLRQGRSVLDRMGDRFTSLKGKLSSRDQTQLGDYTDAVRDMEKQLQADEAWALKPKPEVAEKPPVDSNDRSDCIGRARLLFDLTRLALQTDSTRVVSIFIRGMDLRPPIEGVDEDHHGLSHHGKNPDKIAKLRIIERAEMAAFRDFLTSLRGTPDGAGGGGSLLDSTQVLIGSNLGDASGHGTTNLPILLAGGGHRHGSHIAGDRDRNTPLGDLYVTMLRKFGMDTDRFGSSTGNMNGLL